MMRRWFAISLWKRVLGGLVLGLLLALVWPDAAPSVAVFGDLFVRAIRMLVAPIVLVTIAAGITSLADPKRLGPLGGRTVGLFALTTALAVSWPSLRYLEHRPRARPSKLGVRSCGSL